MLIKENVCRVLNPPQTADGFRVLNRGRKVYLPINGNQGHFRRQFGEILVSSGGSVNGASLWLSYRRQNRYPDQRTRWDG